METANPRSKKALYITLLIATILLGLDIWYVTNNLQFRNLGYMLWEGGITILLLLIGALLAFKYGEDKRTRNGLFITFGILIFEVIVMMNYVTLGIDAEKLNFYFYLSVSSAVILLAVMVGNIIGIEKKSESGFNIYIYGKDSPIPPKLLVPLWIAIFFAMGGFVFGTGSVLMSYPQLSAMKFLGGPAIGSFGVGDWEDISFMIFPFALAFLILRFWLKFPNVPSTVVSIIIGSVSFTVYHTLKYQTNMVAMLIVLAVGAVSLVIYKYTKSIVLVSAIHVGNNFWGALFSATVFGLSAFGGFGAGVIWVPIVLALVMALISFGILKLVKRNAGKKKQA